MYKVGFIGRYREGVGRDEGRAHWLDVHAGLTAAVPGLERYVLNLSTQNLGETGVNDDPVAYDGYAWLWFADPGTFEAGLASDEWSRATADAAEFLDIDWSASMAAHVEENVVIGGAEGPVKVGYVCRFIDAVRADDAKSDEAHDYWKETHGGAFGVKVPGIDRYQQNHVVASVTGIKPDWDGLSECWFPDRAAFEVTMASAEWDAMNRDAYNLFAVQEFHMAGFSAFVDEFRIV